ncbi:MAG: hypothetical protein ABI778_09325, partial [Ignavibacteriota bacterium]
MSTAQNIDDKNKMDTDRSKGAGEYVSKDPDDSPQLEDGVLGTKWNEQDYDSTVSGDDLDVPGSEA